MAKGKKGFLLAAVAVCAAAAACQTAPPSATDASAATSPASSPVPSESLLPTPSADLSTLTVWLPPAFRSDSDSPGGNVLQQRIDAFAELHPGLRIQVRIKSAAGAGGLRDSLAAAAAAAPGALPDLVALDQPNLRAAAIKGLIEPLDGLLPSDSWNDVYPFARTMAVIEDIRYGMPFASDAIILAGTITAFPEPERWDQTFSWTMQTFLPLGDSRSLFLFFGYYAAGGSPMLDLADADIDPGPLEQTLAWLLALQSIQVVTAGSLQIESFESSYLAIKNSGGRSATLYSIVADTRGVQLTHLPTPDGEKFTLATGWAWAIASPDPARRAKGAELLAWLSEPQFLAEWTKAQGVLPASAAVLGLWSSGDRTDFAGGVLDRAWLFPDDEITAFAGPIFAQAARRVLLEGILPLDAAQEAAEAVRV